MATTFATVTAWELVLLDPANIDGGRNPPGAEYEAPEGYTFKRDEYVLTLERFGQGCTSFAPLTGTDSAGNLITWTNGGDTLTGSAAQTYTCIDNQLLTYVQGSSMWREVIIWQYLGAWTETGAPS